MVVIAPMPLFLFFFLDAVLSNTDSTSSSRKQARSLLIQTLRKSTTSPSVGVRLPGYTERGTLPYRSDGNVRIIAQCSPDWRSGYFDQKTGCLLISRQHINDWMLINLFPRTLSLWPSHDEFSLDLRDVKWIACIVCAPLGENSRPQSPLAKKTPPQGRSEASIDCSTGLLNCYNVLMAPRVNKAPRHGSFSTCPWTGNSSFLMSLG